MTSSTVETKAQSRFLPGMAQPVTVDFLVNITGRTEGRVIALLDLLEKGGEAVEFPRLPPKVAAITNLGMAVAAFVGNRDEELVIPLQLSLIHHCLDLVDVKFVATEYIPVGSLVDVHLVKKAATLSCAD
ncbi:MAG: hypothetical protein WC531_03290 [Candidatus Paceibacterota bacterium]|jgi:hypothetical protein